MNRKALQAYFVNADNMLEILQAREEVFNKYILSKGKEYSSIKISARLNQMFNTLVADSKNQVNETFKDVNNPPAYKINLMIDMLKIMLDKKLKFVHKDIVSKELGELERLLKAKFESIKTLCAKKMDVAKQTFMRVQDEIKVL